MSGGLQQQWGVADPAQAGSDAQSQEFKAAFESAMGAMSAGLQYTAANGERTRHEPLAQRSQALTPKYQSAHAQIDPANPAKAKPAIDAVLAEARSVGQDVAAFRAEAEAAFDEWQSRSAAYDTAVTQVEELSEWQHPKEAAARSLADAVRQAVNDRAYKKAVSVLDQFLPKLQPIYEDMQTQKAGQKEYEPASAALQPRLAESAKPGFAKLATQQAALAPAASAMEASAEARDFVAALAASSALSTQLDAYDKAADALTQLKQAYEQAASQAQSQVQAAPNPSPFTKLAAQQAELAALQQSMESAAQAEEFEQALQQAADLAAKAQAYATGVEEMTQAKQAYDQASAELLPRLQAAPNPSPFQKLAAQRADLATAQQAMEAAAQGEDFEQALPMATELGAGVERYASAVDALTKTKDAYEQASAPALQKLQAAPNPSPYAKLAPQQAELVSVQQAAEAAATGEDYEQAQATIGELATKVDAYVAAVAAQDAQKTSYENGLAGVRPVLEQATQSQVPEAAGVQKELVALRQQMEAAAQAGEYEQALKLVADVKNKADEVLAVTPSSGISTKFSFDVSPAEPIGEIKSVPYTKGKATLKLEVSGEISGTGSTNKIKAGSTGLPGAGNAGFKSEIELFKTKFGAGVLGTKFTEGKGSVGFELSLKKVDVNVGVTFKIQTGWSWLAGTGGVKFKFAEADWKKLQANKPPTVASLEFSGGLQGEKTLTGADVGLGEGYEIKVTVKGTITAAFTPDWAKIFGEIGEKVAEAGAKEVAKDAATTAAEGTAETVGEGVAAVVGGEVIIAGALVIGGVATIGGAIFTVVRGFAIGDLAKSYTPSVEAAKAGFRAGMSNGSAPGDRFGAVGFEQGRRNHQALVARTKQEHPDAADDAIAQAVAAKADEALAQLGDAISRAVREGMWYGYIGQHTTLLLGDEARWGYVACFGDEPNSNAPDAAWKAYMDQHPMQSKASPK